MQHSGSVPRSYDQQPRTNLSLLLLTLLISYSPLLASAVYYFESNPACGFTNSSQFLNFEASSVYQAFPSLGVCNWGYGVVLQTPEGISGTVDQCIQCLLVAGTGRTACPEGFTDSSAPTQTWPLASIAGCSYTGCLSLACPAGTIEYGQPAICEGGTARNCCPTTSHQLCCRTQRCTSRDTPAGGCVDNQSRDLLPGQVIQEPQYGVSVSSADCGLYALVNPPLTVCQADRTFTTEFYDSCQRLPPIDPVGTACPAVPGYTFQQGLPADLAQALLDDGTPWANLSSPLARQTAAADLLLMATRCNRPGLPCSWFSTNDNASLHSYLPIPALLAPSNGSAACQGTYVKLAQPRPGSCPRVPGFLFKPMVSVDPLDSLPACDACWNSTQLAAACAQDAACAGFSNLHGLLRQPLPPALTAFTTSRCFGSFQRLGGPSPLPQEVQLLDQLLCGDATYCEFALDYAGSTSTASSGVELHVTVSHDLAWPVSLTAPDSESVLDLPSMPNVRALVVSCRDGASLTGGVPRPLFLVLPNLEKLVVSGCGMTGSLPPEWSKLQALQVLDASRNALGGPLPEQWSTMQLLHLDLSWNALTGYVPQSWWNIIQPNSTSSGSGSGSGSGFGSLPLADLGYNALAGPLPRVYVEGACRYDDARLGFGAGGGAGALEGDGSPRWSFVGNPDMEGWAAPYAYAARKSSYSSGDRKSNMCGSYQYIIALSLMWGAFVLVVAGVAAWWLWRRRQARRAAAKAEAKPEPEPEPPTRSGGSDGQLAAVPADSQAVQDTQSKVQRWESLWNRRSVRRAVFLCRFCWLLVDVALDISVAVWLLGDGSSAEGVVCACFVALAQAAVALVSFLSLVPLLFGSICGLLMLSPLMLAVMPVLAPLLAVWNAFNPNIPLVFWRYMELVEFAIMLLQAPAESVTQSIIYARQNQVANGMYMNHGLFLASIIFSLGDMTISIFKLARYKHGPWRRIVIAITHLDSARDTTPYRTDFAYYSNFRPTTPMLWQDDEGGEALLDGEPGRQALADGSNAAVVTNPLMSQLRQHKARKALQWGPLPRQPLMQGSRGAPPGAPPPAVPGAGLKGGLLELGGRAGSQRSVASTSVYKPGDGPGDWRIVSTAAGAAAGGGSGSGGASAAASAATSPHPFRRSPAKSVGSFPEIQPFPELEGVQQLRVPSSARAPPPPLLMLPPLNVTRLDSGLGLAARADSFGFGLASRMDSFVSRTDSFGPALALPLPPSVMANRPMSPHASEVVGGILKQSMAGPRPTTPTSGQAAGPQPFGSPRGMPLKMVRPSSASTSSPSLPYLQPIPPRPMTAGSPSSSPRGNLGLSPRHNGSSSRLAFRSDVASSPRGAGAAGAIGGDADGRLAFRSDFASSPRGAGAAGAIGGDVDGHAHSVLPFSSPRAAPGQAGEAAGEPAGGEETREVGVGAAGAAPLLSPGAAGTSNGSVRFSPMPQAATYRRPRSGSS